MIITYDFDGVFHKSVERSNIQRMSLDPPYVPFSLIINKIMRELPENKIFIITARSHCKQNVDNMTDFFKETGLDYDHIMKIFTDGESKVPALKAIMANEFYDDSGLRIRQVYYAKQRGLLPHLESIFFVRPEYDDYVLIDNKNIDILCPIVWREYN